MVRRTLGGSPSTPSSTVTSVTVGRSASAMVVIPRSATALAARAEQHRRDVGDDLVDQAGAHERGREGRTALEEDVLPVAGVQLGEGVVRVAGAQVHRLGRRAASSKTRRPGSRSRSPITARSGCAGQRPVVLVADGQPRVVDGHGVGADQHRVAQRPQPVGVASARRSLETQRLVPSAAALRPSRVAANFQVTKGRPVVDREGPDPVQRPRLVLEQAARRPRRPPRAGWRRRRRRPGWGRGWAKTTRRTPASTSACAHGPVRPVWLHGSRVTTAVVPRAAWPARGQRVGLGVGGAGAAVVALGDGAARRRRAARSRRGGWDRGGRRACAASSSARAHRALLGGGEAVSPLGAPSWSAHGLRGDGGDALDRR